MNFNEYISKNRHKLDVETPNEDYLWTGIVQSIINKKKTNRFMVFKIAASIVIVLALSVISYQLISIRNNQQLILANIDPKLAKQEIQLQKQIKTYYKVLQSTNYNKYLLTNSFNDLEYIDTLINQYSIDLKRNGPNPKLINSLMDLYYKKIRLLDRMLNEIEKEKNYENNETNI